MENRNDKIEKNCKVLKDHRSIAHHHHTRSTMRRGSVYGSVPKLPCYVFCVEVVCMINLPCCGLCMWFVRLFVHRFVRLNLPWSRVAIEIHQMVVRKVMLGMDREKERGRLETDCGQLVRLLLFLDPSLLRLLG